MGQRFKQITYPDRIAICHLLRAGVSKDQIAEQLGTFDNGSEFCKHEKIAEKLNEAFART